jgi:hypothetical protein
MNGLWVLFSKETFSQLLKFLRVTEQGEQTHNNNDVAKRRYLEFRLSRDEDEPKHGGSEHKGHTRDEENDVGNEGVMNLRQRWTKPMAYPIPCLHQCDCR